MKGGAEKKAEVVPTINKRLGGGLAAAVKAKNQLAAAESKKPTTKKRNLVADDDSYYDAEEDEDEGQSTNHESGSQRPSTASLRGVNHYEILRETLSTPSKDERAALAQQILVPLEEDEWEYYDEEDDYGIDNDLTEEDMTAAKLRALHTKLEDEYNQGFDPEKDPNKLIEMKTLQMTFLNIGPRIENLEFFENLENVFLQHNCISMMS